MYICVHMYIAAQRDLSTALKAGRPHWRSYCKTGAILWRISLQTPLSHGYLAQQKEQRDLTSQRAVSLGGAGVSSHAGVTPCLNSE